MKTNRFNFYVSVKRLNFYCSHWNTKAFFTFTAWLQRLVCVSYKNTEKMKMCVSLVRDFYLEKDDVDDDCAFPFFT